MTTIEDLLRYLRKENHEQKTFQELRERLGDKKIADYIRNKNLNDVQKEIADNPQGFELNVQISHSNQNDQSLDATESPIQFSTFQDMDGFEPDIASKKDDGPSWLTLGLILWSTGFFVWLAAFEPYGYRMDDDEIAEAAFTFVGGAVLWVALCWGPKALASNTLVTTPIKNKAKDIFTEQQRKQLTDFITLLRNADDEEVGLALAASVSFAHYFAVDTSIDLFEPSTALLLQPDLSFQFARQIEEAQAAGNMVAASQRMVWAHTLRACNNGQLRGHGRELWGELMTRGLPHAEACAESIELFTGRPARLGRLGEVPAGLTPREVKQPEIHTTKTTSTKRKKSAKKRLEELRKLHQDGLVTDDVFEKMQVEILRDQ